MSFTDELKKKGITQNNISGTTQKTFTQQLEERKNNTSTVPNVTNNAIKTGLSIATKSIEGAKQQAPSSINNTIKTGLKLATDTVKQQNAQNFLRNNVTLPKQGNYRLPVKSVSMDSMEKKKPTILDIPVMAAKAALEVPGDLKNLSIYGVRALGEAITGQPVESYRPEGYSFVKDILPEAAGNALDKFEKNQPLAGGFTKFILENTVGDPTNLVGGSGTLGELSKVGFLGKNSITNTVDNLKTIGNLNNKSFATVDKTLNKQVDKAMSKVKTVGMNTDETAATAEPLTKPVQSVKNVPITAKKSNVIELPINKTEPITEANTGTKTRSFANTVKNSDLSTPELKNTLSENMPEYTPISNKKTFEKAENLVNQNIDAAKNQFTTMGKGATADDVAIGEALIKKAIVEGNVSEANRITVDLASKLTEAGQAVQAASIFKRLTPEGMLMYANQVVGAINRNIEKEFGRFAKKVTLSKDEASEILSRMQNAVQLPEGRQKAVEMSRTMQIITNKMPSTLIDKSRTLRNIALLGNTKTFTRNVLGNVLMGGFDTAANVIGTPLDFALSKLTKQRSVALPSPKVLTKSFGKGAVESISDSLGGLSLKELKGSSNKLKTIMNGISNPIDTSVVSGNKFELGRKLSFKNKPMRIAENVINTSLGLGDRPFSQAYYNDVLNQLKKSNKVTEATTEMIETAKRVAEERTYQDINTISRAFDAMKSWPKHLEGPIKKRVIQIFMDTLIPYARTPANIIKRGLEMTPVGVVEGLSKLGVGLLKKDIGINAQREIIDRISRGLIGSSLILAGMEAYKKGLATGAPNKDADVAAFEKNLGKLPYALRFGNNYYTYEWAQPVTMPFAAGTQISASKKNGSDILSTIIDAGANALNYFADQPTLQAMQRLFGSSNNTKTVGDRVWEAALGFPSQFVPTAFKQATQLFNKEQKNTYSPNLFENNFTNQIKAKIPGMYNTLPNKIDTFGNVVNNYQGNNNMFNVLFNPGNSTTYNPNDVQKEILRIYDTTGETVQFPRVADKTLIYTDPSTKKKVSLNLTPKEYEQYQIDLGKQTEQAFKDTIGNYKYSRADDAGKSKILQNVITDTNKKIKDSILRSKGLIK